MQKQPLVSVVIPVYNTEKYLPQCLDSVLCQTLRDIEVLCIDDASPDRCGEILDEYAVRDPRVKVFHLPENHKQGYGRNLGIQHAEGEFLYFLDSDDMIEPAALEELIELAKKEKLDAVFFDSRDLFESEEIKRVYTPAFEERHGDYPDRPVEGKVLFDLFIEQNEWTCYPQRIFWRRDFIIREGIRNPEGSEHEDEYFAFAGILLAKRAMYVPKQYFILRIRPNSVMTSKYMPKNFHGYLVNYYRMSRFVAEREIHTLGADLNITRMYERSCFLYNKLSAEYDLREFCSRRESDKILYECFEQHIKAVDYMNRIDPGVLQQIESCSHLYIYGAGIVADRFARKVVLRKNIHLDGFLVSQANDNVRILYGRPVTVFSETKLPEDALVVAAVGAGLRGEVSELLERSGVRWIYYRDVK
ncbi:MAG: glycosyltransferase family 2 protein [Erysipelotrichaceae bacterium]|nr:glycosyltransferase family 2 protein [Erysipelotrichaceae bacterium]